MVTKALQEVPRRMVIVFLMFVLVFAFFPLLVAGKWDWWQGWAYGIVMLVNSVLSRVLIAKHHPDLLAERGKTLQHVDAKSWDRYLSPLVATVGPLLILLVCGLDQRFSLTAQFPGWVHLGALTVIILGSIFSSWALVENRFFSGTVRIQHERGHSVVDSGPYRIVRHPGYAGGLFVFLAIPGLLNSLWGIVPALLTAGVMALRTALEDRTLQEELPGYQAYAQRTRYRLLPGIW